MDAGDRTAQDSIAEFTVINGQLSRVCPANEASALGTFLTQHGSKMVLVRRSQAMIFVTKKE